MGKEEFFTLKAIIFAMDTEIKLAKQNIMTKKRHYPLPGLQQTLQMLAQKGIRLTMISSLSQQEIKEGSRFLNIEKYFRHLISADEVGCAISTQEFLDLALQRSGVTQTESLLVTDSYYGIKAAKTVSLPCIAFLHPHSKNADFSHADILLESFDGLSSSFFFHVHSRSHGQPITIASTRRLWIRELAAENIPALCAIYQDPKIRRFITDINDSIEDEAAKQTAYINTVYRFYGYGLWGIFLKSSGALIGRCGIENHNIAGKEEITLSYLLDKKYRGQGYALEACKAAIYYAQEELDIQRIVAVIDCDNRPSLQTAANLGMKPEQELFYKNHSCVLFTLE